MAQILRNIVNSYLYVYHAVAVLVVAQAPPRGIPTGARPDLKAEGGVLSRPTPKMVIMADQSSISYVKYCQHHNRVWSPKNPHLEAGPRRLHRRITPR